MFKMAKLGLRPILRGGGRLAAIHVADLARVLAALVSAEVAGGTVFEATDGGEYSWSDLVGAMDRNDGAVLGATVTPVDQDKDGTLLKQAIAEHTKNPIVFTTMASGEFRDDVLAPPNVTWEWIGTLHYKKEIERSKVPMLAFVSWLDAGTADGTLFRFRHFSNTQKVLVMAGMHGGVGHASPYAVSDKPLPPRPTQAEQFTMRRKFFDRYLKGEPNDVDSWPGMRFFNLGEEAFHDTDVWPPKGTTNQDVGAGPALDQESRDVGV